MNTMNVLFEQIQNVPYYLAATLTAVYLTAKFPTYCIGMWRLFRDPRAKQRIGDSPHFWHMEQSLARVSMIQARILPAVIGAWVMVFAPGLISAFLL